MQLKNKEAGMGEYFFENELAEDLAELGAISRPGTNRNHTVEEYRNERTPNQPHVSSFRMANRILRLLGFTTRYLNLSNAYVVTHRGIQLSKFEGPFPAKISYLDENDIVVRSLLNANVFSVNDNLNMWDTRFRNRIVVNLLRCASVYGYITNQEAIVTAFTLKDERDEKQIKDMIKKIRDLNYGKISLIDAYRNSNVDPHSSSATNNAYDSPKVLTSLCRQTGLFERETYELKDTPYGDLRQKYKKMLGGRSAIKAPHVVNVITDLGRRVLDEEISKKLISFEQLA